MTGTHQIQNLLAYFALNYMNFNCILSLGLLFISLFMEFILMLVQMRCIYFSACPYRVYMEGLN
jgi:hypothetical protein